MHEIIGPEMLVLALLADLLNLILRQLERRHTQIVLESRFFTTRRDCRYALVDAPSKCNRLRTYVVLARERGEDFVTRSWLGFRDGGQGAKSRDGDFLRFAPRQEVLTLQVRVKLHLIDARRDFGCRQGRFEMRLEIIGDADRASFSGFLDLLHLGPGLLQFFICRCKPWGVDEIEIHVVEL